jgi:hypothetical protein
MVGSLIMEEDIYLDLFLDPYTIQVSLAATLLRTRAGVGLGDLFEMTNPPQEAGYYPDPPVELERGDQGRQSDTLAMKLDDLVLVVK